MIQVFVVVSLCLTFDVSGAVSRTPQFCLLIPVESELYVFIGQPVRFLLLVPVSAPRLKYQWHKQNTHTAHVTAIAIDYLPHLRRTPAHQLKSVKITPLRKLPLNGFRIMRKTLRVVFALCEEHSQCVLHTKKKKKQSL